MIDIRLIREQPEMVKAAIGTLNTDAPIDEVIHLDERRRALLAEVEQMKAERNAGSRIVSRLAPGPEREAQIAAMRALGERIQELDRAVAELDAELNDLLLQIPNLPDPDVPVGPDESANIVVRAWGEPREFAFPVRPHWEIAEQFRLIDFERGVKVGGSRFYFLRGDLARLQRALAAWMIDLHVREHGFTEVYPPFLVRREAMIGTGNLPKFGDALYHDDDSDLWLIPTAEVPVTNLYRDEILDGAQLPINHTAYSACFRNEKASAGRDVRGIKRLFQFDKVELVKFVRPEESPEEHMRLAHDAAETLERLELPYRTVEICAGDLSFVASRKIDLEAWAPGVEEWLEVSSCSNFRDFQARRSNIRFRPGEGQRPQFVHTLNGSGLGMPRTMIAVIENYQNQDGSITIPAILRPYMGGQERIGPV